ncbi:ankyrin, partial [Plenodomus tracheiphilus IPT5]
MEATEIYKCDKCPKSFVTLGRYNQHLKTHSKPYSCNKCVKRFALRHSLTRHIHARHQLGHQKYPCAIRGCEFKATRKDNIRQHMRNIHADQSPAHNVRKTKQLLEDSESPTNPILRGDRMEGDTSSTRVASGMQAASAGNFGLLEVALNTGFDVRTTADDGSTALHCAAITNGVGMVSHLLNLGATTEAHNQRFRTPLHEAVLSHSSDACEVPIKHGAKASDECPHDVVRSGQTLIFEMLMSCSQSHDRYRIARTGHRVAVTISNLAILNAVSSSPYIEQNWLTDFTKSVLRFVMYSGRTDVLRFLLESGMLDPNTWLAGRERSFLLHVAALKGHTKMIELLLSHEGIQVNARNRSYCTPLQEACAAGQTAVVRLLLQHPDTRMIQVTSLGTRETTSAFHQAVHEGFTETVQLLLSHLDGITSHDELLDNRERTPLQLS